MGRRPEPQGLKRTPFPANTRVSVWSDDGGGGSPRIDIARLLPSPDDRFLMLALEPDGQHVAIPIAGVFRVMAQP